ncbi:hypothetical protein [Jannaschia sp. R86511]|uniref:hypothetical protein n=1 Tax=Jannaschia sp. R86511 TaxID=3093853 RepID=UPI0036D38F61
MTGAGGPRLVVDADLRVRVTDPRGRTADVVVDDHDGALRVRLDRAGDLAVLVASLPAPPLAAALAAPLRGLRSGSGPVPARWDQDVEVVLGSRLLLRRRAGRWRPAGAALVPVAGAATLLAGLLVLLVALVRSRRERRDRSGR